MFDQLFESQHALARHLNGPLVEERRRYLMHCAEQQMAQLTLRRIAVHTLIVANALRLANRPGHVITRSEIDIEAECWANRHPKPESAWLYHNRWQTFRGQALRWLTFMGRLEPLPTVKRPYAKHVAQYRDYQLQERGLSPQTVAYATRTIHEFLGQAKEAGFMFRTLSVAQVDDLLAKKIHEDGYARGTIHSWVSTLRPFFRFAERHSWCRKGLADAIMAPRLFKHESLPLGPSWGDVKRLLAATSGKRPVDIRNHALLMLLAVYGLRAGEATALRLEDFDWEREILNVPTGKAGKPRIYPLCRPAGDAVLRYLQEVRPRLSRREVFLTMVAPFRPVTPSALGSMVRRHLHALGLTLLHYGPHTLRHACATHLLEQGLSLKEIGDHLGHRSPETTSIYAKVDLTALRRVAEFSLEGLL